MIVGAFGSEVIGQVKIDQLGAYRPQQSKIIKKRPQELRMALNVPDFSALDYDKNLLLYNPAVFLPDLDLSYLSEVIQQNSNILKAHDDEEFFIQEALPQVQQLPRLVIQKVESVESGGPDDVMILQVQQLCPRITREQILILSQVFGTRDPKKIQEAFDGQGF